MADVHCPNCGTPSGGQYCPTCGQRLREELIPTVWVWMREVMDELLLVDGRLPRTLRALLWPPGHLTLEWWRGRQASYITPLKLYLVAAIPFFSVFTLENAQRNDGDERFLSWIIELAYVSNELERGLELHEALAPLPAELHDDTTARSAWRAEALRRRAENDSIWASVELGAGASVQRMLDLLPIAVGLIMVPFLALLLMIGSPFKTRFVASLVFSLHLHAVGYALAGLGWLVGAGLVAGLGGSAVYGGFALHKVTGDPAPVAGLRAGFFLVAYSGCALFFFVALLQGLRLAVPTWFFGS